MTPRPGPDTGGGRPGGETFREGDVEDFFGGVHPGSVDSVGTVGGRGRRGVGGRGETGSTPGRGLQTCPETRLGLVLRRSGFSVFHCPTPSPPPSPSFPLRVSRGRTPVGTRLRRRLPCPRRNHRPRGAPALPGVDTVRDGGEGGVRRFLNVGEGVVYDRPLRVVVSPDHGRTSTPRRPPGKRRLILFTWHSTVPWTQTSSLSHGHTSPSTLRGPC